MIRTDTALKQEAMNLLIANLGLVDAERFLVLISRESFDYTEWRRDHLPEEADVRSLSRKAAEYAKTLGQT